MGLEVKNILKKVFYIDIVIIAIVFIISYKFYKPYQYVVIIGLLLSALNFMANAVTTNYILAKSGKKIIIVLSSAVRIIITLGIVIILCNSDKFKYIAIIIGYTLHYLAVILYGLTTGIKKGSD